jgi:glycosyltransferase involved in cell wall biosynthesis
MIIFVGPLPPPVHGFSLINAAMLIRFQALAKAVKVFNRAPDVSRTGVANTLRGLASFARYVGVLWRSPVDCTLYIGLSGGWGQLKDLPYVLTALVLGRPVLVHHHSFAYLRRMPWHTRIVLGSLRGASHIALCKCMAKTLSTRYRIPYKQVDVISNAAFLERVSSPTVLNERAAERIPNSPLRLGFLSNITADKGIWAFFELLDVLSKSDVPFEALIGGPLANDIQRRFHTELMKYPSCSHLGAVYGEQKASFFSSIDVLIFPTFYANEAEPVTVLEALACGVPVVANARGCIAEMLPPSAGAVFSQDSQFVALAANCLQAWADESPERWLQRRQAAFSVFAELQSEHAARVTRIVRRTLGLQVVGGDET